MDRIDTLREQANVLRALAQSFDAPALRENLLSVTQRCEELAARAEREKTDDRTRPIAG